MTLTPIAATARPLHHLRQEFVELPFGFRVIVQDITKVETIVVNL
jgi:hypothetical protein